MNKNLDAIILRYTGYTLVFLFAFYALFLVRGVLPIFGVALLFGYALEPILRRLESRGRGRNNRRAGIRVGRGRRRADAAKTNFQIHGIAERRPTEPRKSARRGARPLRKLVLD